MSTPVFDFGRDQPAGDVTPVKMLVNGEFDIWLPEYRAVQPHWDTGWEVHRLKAMRERCGDGDVVFYVGAEEGEMPALCQMWGAQVVLFEPQPKVWPNIRTVFDINKLEPPLGSFVGFASTYTYQAFMFQGWPPQSDGPVTGTNHGFVDLAASKEAPQIRLDDVSVAQPTIISIDVEGSEWQVLKGAELTLREYHPTLFVSVHPEFMFHQWGQYSRDLRDWLCDLGYHEQLLDWKHEAHFLYEVR